MPVLYGTDTRTAADPFQDATEITKSDATTFPATRGVYVGSAGNLKVTMACGTDVTFTNVPVGFHPLCVTKIFSTGTAASGFLGLY